MINYRDGKKCSKKCGTVWMESERIQQPFAVAENRNGKIEKKRNGEEKNTWVGRKIKKYLGGSNAQKNKPNKIN
jgi:hypothetical protein